MEKLLVRLLKGCHCFVSLRECFFLLVVDFRPPPLQPCLPSNHAVILNHGAGTGSYLAWLNRLRGFLDARLWLLSSPLFPMRSPLLLEQ